MSELRSPHHDPPYKQVTVQVALKAELAGHSLELTDIGFSTDGRFLVTVGYKDPVRIWDVATQVVVRELTGYPAPVSNLALSPDGMLIAAALENGAIWIWTLDGQFVEELPALIEDNASPGLVRVAFSPRGTPLASIDQRGTIHLWDLLPAKLLSTIPIQPSEQLVDVFPPADPPFFAWAPNGNRIARERRGGSKHAILVEAPPLDINLQSPYANIVDISGPIYDMAYSPGAKYLAIAKTDGRYVQLCDATSLTIVRELRDAGDEVAIRLCFSPDGKTLAVSEGKGSVALWEVASGRMAARFPAHSEHWDPSAQAFPITAIAWSSDGRLLATAGWRLLPTYRTRHGGSSKRRHVPPSGGPSFLVRLWSVASIDARYNATGTSA